MEHNMLFNASTRFQVTQTGSATLDLETLFDGRFGPAYSPVGPSFADPTVILIENLPDAHVQAGAWVGWSTRYWPAVRFKIEAYDVHLSNNTWITIADYTTQNYSNTSFIQKLPSGSYTKLRFTFYTAYGVNGRLGVSELFYIHPEAVSPYDGLLTGNSNTTWNNNGSDINYSSGKVGIGTTTPDSKLSVNGKIHAKEVKVDLTGWPDYVFASTYKLPTLREVEKHIKEKGHLKGVPSAKEVAKNGILLGEMNSKLLQKIEELMLYTIQQDKRLKKLEDKIKKSEK
jgi:hypothetical protein